MFRSVPLCAMALLAVATRFAPAARTSTREEARDDPGRFLTTAKVAVEDIVTRDPALLRDLLAPEPAARKGVDS